MKNKSIILSFIILFITSAIFLAWYETKLASPQNQSWWSLYFVNAKDDSLNFAIENNSDQKNFHWELSDGNNKINQGDVQINKGETKKINLTKSDFMNSQNKETITVTATSDKKEIYKIFR